MASSEKACESEKSDFDKGQKPFISDSGGNFSLWKFYCKLVTTLVRVLYILLHRVTWSFFTHNARKVSTSYFAIW